LRQAFLIITPAQYWISAGKVGGGFGSSLSEELGRNVNLSTRENTFVSLIVDPCTGPTLAAAFSFSFPLPVADANALNKGLDSLVLEGDVTVVFTVMEVPALFANIWVAGWNEGRVL
jgi:hypothetical protein